MRKAELEDALALADLLNLPSGAGGTAPGGGGGREVGRAKGRAGGGGGSSGGGHSRGRTGRPGRAAQRTVRASADEW
jgi:hypothetical protein